MHLLTTPTAHESGGSISQDLPTLSASQRLTHAYGKLEASSSVSLASSDSSQSSQGGSSTQTRTVDSHAPQKLRSTGDPSSRIHRRRKYTSPVTTIVFDPFNVRMDLKYSQAEPKTVGLIHPTSPVDTKPPKQIKPKSNKAVNPSPPVPQTCSKKTKLGPSLIWRPGQSSKPIADPEYPFAGKSFSSRSTAAKSASSSTAAVMGSPPPCVESSLPEVEGGRPWNRPVALSEMDCFAEKIALVGEYWGWNPSTDGPKAQDRPPPQVGVEKGRTRKV